MQVLSALTRAHLASVDGGAGITVSWANTNSAALRLTGVNCTLLFTAPAADAVLYLRLTQDGTGSRLVTWHSSVKWPGGVSAVLSTAANAVDIVTFVYDATAAVYYAQCANDFR